MLTPISYTGENRPCPPFGGDMSHDIMYARHVRGLGYVA